MYETLRIEFHGAAREVTGSKHLIITSKGTKILLDCGLLQDSSEDVELTNRNFNFKPSEVDFLILSHAHIDHSGNIPNLVKQGFKGPIFMTDATADILKIMLMDSAKIQEHEIEFNNKKRKKEGRKALEPLYGIDDVEKTFTQFHILEMNEKIKISEEWSCLFTDAGHILGSACVSLFINDKHSEKVIFFSGDVGRYNDRILKAPAIFPQADYILLESTYGNRLHDRTENAENKLQEIIHRTCVLNKGNLIIPAFSLGRTQEIVYALDRMKTEGKLPAVKIFVDSPLSTNATNIMRKHTDFFNEDIVDYMHRDPDPFGFSNLKYVQSVEDSRAINELNEPCIIIAASGMMEAGRIKHHLTHNIENPKNTLLIVGYCAENTLGGKILNGAKEVSIFNKVYQVNAKVEVISSYSAHADYLELLKFMSCQSPEKVKQIFLVHGNIEAQNNLKKLLNESGFENVKIPQKLDVENLN